MLTININNKSPCVHVFYTWFCFTLKLSENRTVRKHATRQNRILWKLCVVKLRFDFYQIKYIFYCSKTVICSCLIVLELQYCQNQIC